MNVNRDRYLKHVGVLGMHWGRRKGSSPASTGGSKRKTGFGDDGRKVNRPLGAVNRKKIRNYFLGNPAQLIKNVPVMNKKYNSLSKERQGVMMKRTSNALAAISVVSMVALAAMIKGKL